MIARIAAVTQARGFARSVPGNRDAMRRLLAPVFAHQPDLVCLPEAFTAKGVPVASVADVAETVPGPTTDALAALAREHRCYVVCPIYTRRDGVYRNSAVVLDRSGEVAGIYDKRRPCATAPDYSVFELGVVPGREQGIIDVDFGRIALRICMDVNFPDDWTVLAEHGVKLVLWPSATEGSVLLQAHAITNHCYVVAAVRAGRAQVIDAAGRIIAASTATEPFVVADVNLDFAVVRTEFHRALANRIAAAYGSAVTLRTNAEDGLLLIEPASNDITVERLQREFGFETGRESLRRYREAYARTPP